MRYRGLTWDHPRGYDALAAAAAPLREESDGLELHWDKQPLEGFESHPIEDLCARYDLVVLDHPHIGEAAEAGCLQPLDGLFDAEELAALGAATIGPCLSSYRYGERQWALPLDAATQVMAYRPDLLDMPPPLTWADVDGLQAPVAMSLAGPHAVLSFQSMATAFGEPPAEADPEIFVGTQVGLQALDLLHRLAERMPASVRTLNPIGLLGHMAAQDDVVLCPLVYGYVNYAAPKQGRAIAFSDAPRASAAGRPGSTLGGTGIGISTRAEVTKPLLDHLRWLMGAEAQERFIPMHGGQPSRRSAWLNGEVNSLWGDFYFGTAETLENAFVRPRHAGAIPFQTAASAAIRRVLEEGGSHGRLLDELQLLYARSRKPGAER